MFNCSLKLRHVKHKDETFCLLGQEGSTEPFVKVCWRHSLYDPVFTGGKVIFGCVDEGNPEVEHQIDDQRAGILCQKDLKERRTG